MRKTEEEKTEERRIKVRDMMLSLRKQWGSYQMYLSEPEIPDPIDTTLPLIGEADEHR